MKKGICLVVTLLLVAAAAAGGYTIGKNSAVSVTGTTFYATIDEISGDTLLVSGLEINDINSRGRFYLQAEGDTALEWRHTQIQLSDLKEGDLIAITYTGPVSETEPAGLSGVVRIQLLED